MLGLLRLCLLACCLLAILGGVTLCRQTEAPADAVQAVPSLAIRPSQGVITVSPSSDNEGLGVLAILVWLPMAAALAAFTFASFIHDLPSSVLFVPYAAAGLAVLLGATSLSWAIVMAIMLVIAWLLIRARVRNVVPADTSIKSADPHPWFTGFHLFVVGLLVLSGVCLSLATHLILVKYRGLGPSPDIQSGELRELVDSVGGSDTYDPLALHSLASEMKAVHGVNAISGSITPFPPNWYAGWVYVAFSFVYLFIWVWLLSRRWRRRLPWGRILSPSSENRLRARIHGTLPPEVRVPFAVVFYVSVGAAFAMLYYSAYLDAASKQNVMLRWAENMQLRQEDMQRQLERERADKQWSEALDRRILKRVENNPALAAKLDAIRARYWPVTIIVQERPRAGRSGDVPTTSLVIDPQISFYDMIYFSFVSFTTTGYGDIKPVSDAMRFMTVFENVMEILFTAMFFVVAMGSRE